MYMWQFGKEKRLTVSLIKASEKSVALSQWSEGEKNGSQEEITINYSIYP